MEHFKNASGWRSNTLQSERKSGKSPDNNRAADDRLSRKSRKRKKKKNKERDFRSGSWDPGGGGGRGGDALRARAPRGQVPSALPPFPFSPSLPPEGGRTPDPISIELYRHISFAIRFSEMAKPSLRLCIRLMANGECKISNFHYSIIDYLLNG